MTVQHFLTEFYLSAQNRRFAFGAAQTTGDVMTSRLSGRLGGGHMNPASLGLY